MVDSIEDLARRLVLTEEEESEVVVEEGHLHSTEAKAGLCLVGKLLTMRPFNMDALRSTLTFVWKASKGVVFKTLGDNLFLIQFGHIVDKRRVMANGPWSFDKHLVLLKEFNGALQPLEITFSTMEFWVHASNLPLISMTRAVGVLLGNNLGKFVDIEYGDGGIAWGRTLRIRVEINIDKPLRRGLKVALGGRAAVWITLQYERLSNFCFHCNLLGHTMRDCGNRLLEGAPMEEVRLQYGPWLRADVPRGRVRRESHGESAKSVGSSQAIPKDFPLHPGGPGVGSTPSFVPATAAQQHPEGTSVEIFKSSKLHCDSTNPMIATNLADFVGSKNGMGSEDFSLAPGSNIQISGEWAGLDQALDGPTGYKDMEVVASFGTEDPACVIEGLGLGG
ncbi:Uncharacterized protein LOK49_Contig250G00003 [Camellia lanceoleosa]|nr:Uncharacterized protein LOK49_Contig250G00003 [Camellia lanceoleosa]